MAEAGKSSLSGSLHFLIIWIKSREIVSFFQAQEELLEKLKPKLKFLESLVDDREGKMITSPLVEKWLVDLQKTVCDAEELFWRRDSVVEVSDGSGKQVMKEAMAKELEVIFEAFERLVQDIILGYLGGGSFLSSLLHDLFDRMASFEVQAFFKFRKFNFNDGFLNKVKATMTSVGGVFHDAEEKQITMPAVKEWLDELRHVVYQAEDVLDEIGYASLQLELETSSHIQVRNILSSHAKVRKEMEVKLEGIIERLEHLERQKVLLGLREDVAERLTDIATASVVGESNMKGDKKSIMKLVLSDDDANAHVIPIVGGFRFNKANLAHLVYNDKRVGMCFDFKAWVYVPNNLDVYQITKCILMSFVSKNCDAKTLDQIQLQLQKRLMGKKFLLVLDNVWNNEFAGWENLLRPLKTGAQGSKIIVTTCNERTASVVRTVSTHHLKELTDGDRQLLLVKHDGNSRASPDLEAPSFAAKRVPDIRCSRRDAQKWGRELQSDQWDLQNDILRVLRLSYLYLPSHLKRCFAYCAIFPKGYEFKKEEIILLWMAEGLVQPYGDMEMEAVADEYFHDLVSMSLFQQSSSYQSHFVLHDLVNDLATFLSEEFCFRLEDEGSCKTSKNTRHLSYARTEHDTLKKFMGIYDTNNLRTFLPLGWSQCWQRKHIDGQVTHGLLSESGNLRVLSLSQYHNVVDLPDSIGNLKHLRYLNLSSTSIKYLPEIVSTLCHLQTLLLHDCRDLAGLPDSIGNLKNLRYLNLHGASIKRLPDSMGGLHNLRTLILCQCKDLVELPANMGELINLRHLDIGGTKLQEMPPQMGELTNLQKLTHFIVGNHSGSSIKELRKLSLLRGELCIWNLQNVVNDRHAFAANLKGKEHIKKLELRWDGVADGSLGVLEHLQPHRNVESITIVGYGGTRFPNWVGDCYFSNIVSMKLGGCKYCTHLPPFGELYSLKDLSIASLGQVVAVGSEFYGNFESIPFRSLKILSFAMMPQWHEWVSNLSAFPLLEELYIRECPNLVQAFPRNLPSLTTLKIEACQELVASVPMSSRLQNLMVDRLHSLDFLSAEMEQISCFSTTLEKIIIMNCDLLKFFPLEWFPKLKTFFIYGCRNLDSFSALEEPLGNFEYLSSFDIGRCSNLASLPNGGLSAPNLTVLRLRDCSNLKSLPDCMHSLLPSLMNLEIVDCPELESFPEGGLLSKLELLKIESCDKLIAARMQWNLQMLPSLSHFQIVEFEDMESFPEKTLLPPTLTSLKIWDLQNLKHLDNDGLQKLTSLRELEISNCPKLEFMPEERLPASLSCLSIWHCSLLEKRCEREKGEDWPKISHIPCIEIIS